MKGPLPLPSSAQNASKCLFRAPKGHNQRVSWESQFRSRLSVPLSVIFSDTAVKQSSLQNQGASLCTSCLSHLLLKADTIGTATPHTHCIPHTPHSHTTPILHTTLKLYHTHTTQTYTPHTTHTHTNHTLRTHITHTPHSHQTYHTRTHTHSHPHLKEERPFQIQVFSPQLASSKAGQHSAGSGQRRALTPRGPGRQRKWEPGWERHPPGHVPLSCPCPVSHVVTVPYDSFHSPL